MRLERREKRRTVYAQLKAPKRSPKNIQLKAIECWTFCSLRLSISVGWLIVFCSEALFVFADSEEAYDELQSKFDSRSPNIHGAGGGCSQWVLFREQHQTRD